MSNKKMNTKSFGAIGADKSKKTNTIVPVGKKEVVKRKPDEERKKNKVLLYFSELELIDIKKYAEKDGLSVPNFLRKRMEKGLEYYEEEMKEYQEFLEFKKAKKA